MSEYKKEAFNKTAIDAAFKAYPKADGMFQTSDGQVFSNENAANAHSYNCKSRVIAFVGNKAGKAPDSSEKLAGTSQEDGVTVKLAKVAIEAITTVKDLEVYVAGDDRKGVIEAAQERKEELEATPAK